MGVNNKQRRAAKQRRRARWPPGRPAGGAGTVAADLAVLDVWEELA